MNTPQAPDPALTVPQRHVRHHHVAGVVNHNRTTASPPRLTFDTNDTFDTSPKGDNTSGLHRGA